MRSSNAKLRRADALFALRLEYHKSVDLGSKESLLLARESAKHDCIPLDSEVTQSHGPKGTTDPNESLGLPPIVGLSHPQSYESSCTFPDSSMYSAPTNLTLPSAISG